MKAKWVWTVRSPGVGMRLFKLWKQETSSGIGTRFSAHGLTVSVNNGILSLSVVII